MWDLDKINQYIKDEIEEDIHLDYKAADSLGSSPPKKAEISKDVSAFANSDGGIIIYGVKEFNEIAKRYLPEKIDPVIRTDYSKEWLEQIINSNISPKIDTVLITPISTTNPNEVLYVVEIPKSNTAHQAKDKRYYKRYNFESVPMDDYEIKDVINRGNKTILKIEFDPIMGKTKLSDFLNQKLNFRIEFEIKIHNYGNIMARHYAVLMYVNEDAKKQIIKPIPQKLDHDNYQLFFSNEVERKIKLDGIEYVINTERIPILPGTLLYLDKIEINSEFIYKNYELVIFISSEDGNRQVNINGEFLRPNS